MKTPVEYAILLLRGDYFTWFDEASPNSLTAFTALFHFLKQKKLDHGRKIH